LTILIGIAKPCEDNDVESIRYAELIKPNNDRLSEFTKNMQSMQSSQGIYFLKLDSQGFISI
jgi:hypothetical protein